MLNSAQQEKISLTEDERRHLTQLKSSSEFHIPNHVAIIMDGNGRWAKQHGLRRDQGHRYGAERLRQIVQAAGVLGMSNLTVYAFSTENWARPMTEIRAIMRLFNHFFEKYDAELRTNDVRIRMLGEYESLPPEAQKTWNRAVDSSRDRRGLGLNIAYNYGGRRELLRAAQMFALQTREEPDLLESNDDEVLRRFLYAPDVPDPDLLIRTSGEMRLSNFLLWELAYTEIYVTDSFWPDFDVSEFLLALEYYQSRDRRFGGLAEHSTEGVNP